MIDRNLARGAFIGAVALYFGLGAFRYNVGTLSHAGPGLFPLMVSGALLFIAVVTIATARMGERGVLEFKFRNIAVLLISLCVFAGVSRLVNMSLGIVAMVFVASLAAKTRSLMRNILVSIGLIAVAFAFQRLLGLNLPLY